MSTAITRQAIHELLPRADETAVARVLRQWTRHDLRQRIQGEWAPLSLGDESKRDAAAKVAVELHDFGRCAPETPAETVLGMIGFMLRNVVAGREATDYGGAFEYFIGAPSGRTRRRTGALTAIELGALGCRTSCSTSRT